MAPMPPRMIPVVAHQRTAPTPPDPSPIPPGVGPQGPILSGPPMVPMGMGPAMSLGPEVDMRRAPAVARSRAVFKPHNQRQGFA